MASGQRGISDKQKYQEFVERCASKPDKFDQVKQEFTQDFQQISSGLAELGRNREFEYVGSSHSGTKIKAGGNEFDVNVVQRLDNVTARPTDKTGVYTLERNPGTNVSSREFQADKLSSKTNAAFKGDIQKAVNNNPDLRDKVK